MLTRTLVAIVIAVIALFAVTEALAELGDGSCQDLELAAKQCINLGPTAVLETIPTNGQFPLVGTCTDPNQPGTPLTCTIWTYRFVQPSGDNQLNFLIPASAAVVTPPGFPAGSMGSCQLFYPNGAGDPTTGFGKGVATHNVCRMAANLDPNFAPPANIVIATTPFLPGDMSVLLKSGKSVFFNDILGPFSPGVPQLSATTEVITTLGGETLTVTKNQTGQIISAIASSGPTTIIPPGGVVLCSPLDPNNVYPTNFPSGYDCNPIVFDDGTNSQAGNNSTCYYYNKSTGQRISYNC